MTTIKNRIDALEKIAIDSEPVQAYAVFYLNEGENEVDRADITQARNEGIPIIVFRTIDARILQ